MSVHDQSLSSRWRRLNSEVKALIIVGGSLAILVALFCLNEWIMDRHNRKLEARNLVRLISWDLGRYHADYGVFPPGSPAEIYRELRTASEKRGEENYANWHFDTSPATGELLDPWGQAVRFDLRNPAQPRVYSTGPNRRDEGGAERSDDIVSWRAMPALDHGL